MNRRSLPKTAGKAAGYSVGRGFGGDIKVKVTMDGDKIANIEVPEHAETASLATTKLTNQGIIDAVNDALSQIKN